VTAEPRYPSVAPWWTPWGAALRLGRVLRQPSDVLWLVRIGWFVARLPANVAQSHLRELMAGLARDARPRASDVEASAERVARLRQPWLRLPGLRSRDTCYVRALTLYRFVDARGHDVRLRLGAEWHDRPGGVLRGHAWVTCDDRVLEGPPEVDDHSRLQLIELS
jgi:hypothetical protein